MPFVVQIINVSKATVQMLGSKIEITLPKAEPGHWASLEFPKTAKAPEKPTEQIEQIEQIKPTAAVNNDDDDSDVDLDDLQQVRGVRITDA